MPDWATRLPPSAKLQLQPPAVFYFKQPTRKNTFKKNKTRKEKRKNQNDKGEKWLEIKHTKPGQGSPASCILHPVFRWGVGNLRLCVDVIAENIRRARAKTVPVFPMQFE